MFKRLFSNKLYVKIYKNKIVVKNLYDDLPPQMFIPDSSFTTTRLLVGTFTPAVKCLKQAVRSATTNSWIKPVLLVQPMEMHEGGLSEIEIRALHECALAAGARKFIIWLGAELSTEKAIEKINSSH